MLVEHFIVLAFNKIIIVLLCFMNMKILKKTNKQKQ